MAVSRPTVPLREWISQEQKQKTLWNVQENIRKLKVERSPDNWAYGGFNTTLIWVLGEILKILLKVET